MHRDDDELTKKLVICQKETKLNGDFYPQVENDMMMLSISEEDVTVCSKEKLRTKLKEKIKEAALAHLLDAARSHSKVRDEIYTDMEGMKYMNDPRFTPEIVNLLFKFRTRMFNVRNNFRNKYRNSDTLCPLCKLEEDSQEHLFQCTKLSHDDHNTQHNDIYSNDTNKLLQVGSTLSKLCSEREEICEDDAA